MTIGSNQLHVGPRLILEDGGGILQKLVEGQGRGRSAGLASGADRPHQVSSASLLLSSVFWILPESGNDIFHHG